MLFTEKFWRHNKLGAILIILSISLLLAWFCYRRLYAGHSPALHNSKGDTIAYFLNRQQYFEVFPKDSNAIIFLGNSLTQNFELAELFQNLKIKNRGIDGDITAGVLNRLAPVIACRPQKIFIEIGINDLGQGISKDSVVSNYEKIIDTLARCCPTAQLYVQSILPVANSSKTLASYCSPVINADIRSVNDSLKKYAALHGATFIDLYSSFVLKGAINPAYAVSDGVHLTGQAYLLWTKLLKPYVDK